jgi:hypothetical protein
MKREGGIVGILGAILGEVLSVITYTMVVAGVYKLFQIASELAEIKNLLKGGAQLTSPSSAAVTPYAEIEASDDASDYAAKLLRSINAESKPVEPSVWPAGSNPR